MNKIVTGVLVLGLAATALADRGDRYSRHGGGLPVPPGIPHQLVPGARGSFLPAPPLPRHLPTPPLPNVYVGGGYYRQSSYGYYRPAYAPVCAPPVYYSRPVYVAPQPVYVAPRPVYVAPCPPPVVVAPAPVVCAPPVVWNPPVVVGGGYYASPGFSIGVSFSR